MKSLSRTRARSRLSGPIPGGAHDVMTATQRARCMSRIQGRDTGPELTLKHAVWQAGLRYRMRGRLPGRPDLVFFKQRVAVFVDGCFWHGCPIHSTKPKNNRSFWSKKLQGNRTRDARVNRELSELGWTVLRFWEHEIAASLAKIVSTIRRAILNSRKHRLGA
jgi:DNA mismatch endonuclease (patch repair protein)